MPLRIWYDDNASFFDQLKVLVQTEMNEFTRRCDELYAQVLTAQYVPTYETFPHADLQDSNCYLPRNALCYWLSLSRRLTLDTEPAD